jgi:hypothetical protein
MNIFTYFVNSKNTPNQPDKCIDDNEALLLFDIDTNFRLPIQYLDEDRLYKLNDVIAYDLELKIPSNYDNTTTMYDHLFKPSHVFAKNTIPLWQQYYTTDIEFLNDTKSVINNLDTYNSLTSVCNDGLDCNVVKNIWKSIKMDDYFVEKHNFMDWEMLKHLNHSKSFLQTLSFVHVLSPVISFILPVLFLIFPFIILKIQGVPISVNVYMDSLKNVAKSHFIGKAITNMETISWDKIVYILFMFGMYIFQIYQNVVLCKRFYKNVIDINNNLIELKKYVDYTICSVESFVTISNKCVTYNAFNRENEEQLNILRQMKKELADIYPFECNLKKFNNVGYMLQCYYQLYNNEDYEYCIRYSVGFHGYIDNLMGIHTNIKHGVVSYANYSTENVCNIKKQYYPGLTEERPVKNDCNFDKNMIISSPNKSGKTTILKSTALNIIFSQQVGCGFYESATITPYTHIHSYLNIPDTSGRDSLFQAESRRCKEIIDIIGNHKDPKYRHFCMFDELYSGTNPEEASKAGYAFLEYLQLHSNVNFILTTHYLSICKKFRKSQTVQNYKMVVMVNPDGTFEYTYHIKKGISRIKGGIRVLKDMNYPSHIINTIESKSMLSNTTKLV